MNVASVFDIVMLLIVITLCSGDTSADFPESSYHCWNGRRNQPRLEVLRSSRRKLRDLRREGARCCPSPRCPHYIAAVVRRGAYVQDGAAFKNSRRSHSSQNLARSRERSGVALILFRMSALHQHADHSVERLSESRDAWSPAAWPVCRRE